MGIQVSFRGPIESINGVVRIFIRILLSNQTPIDENKLYTSIRLLLNATLGTQTANDIEPLRLMGSQVTDDLGNPRTLRFKQMDVSKNRGTPKMDGL